MNFHAERRVRLSERLHIAEQLIESVEREPKSETTPTKEREMSLSYEHEPERKQMFGAIKRAVLGLPNAAPQKRVQRQVETPHQKVHRLIRERRIEEAASLATGLINSNNDDGFFIYAGTPQFRRAQQWYDERVAASRRGIDENLARAELSPAEEALHIKRRKEVWEELRAEKADETGARNSRSSLSDGRKKGPQHERKFAAEVASVVGGGRNPGSVKRDVQLKIARADKLGSDLHRIAGTSLDKGVEMDALIKMKEPERKKIIERAAKGEQVSARPQPKKFEPKTEAERLAVDIYKWLGTNRAIEVVNRLRTISYTDLNNALRKVVEA